MATYYISTTGTITAAGTELDPYSMKYLELANNHAGDTFLVKNGEYNKNWKFLVFGVAGNPVKVKAENWKQAKIVGGTNKYDNKRSVIKLSGPFCWVMDFEIFDNNQKRIWINWSDDILMSTGCELFAPGTKFINNSINNLIEGIECWSTAEGAANRNDAAEAHFNVIYNIGLDFSDDPRPQSGHGHAIYAQNKEGADLPKYFTGNTIWGNFAEGIHFYTEGGNIKSMVCQDNSVFNMIGYAIDKIKSRATIIGSLSKTFDNLVYERNIIFEEAVSIGYGNPWQQNVKVNDNAFYTPSGITMKRFFGAGTEVKRNIFHTENGTLFNYSLSVQSDLDLLNLHDNSMINTSTQWSTVIGIQPPGGGTTQLTEPNWGPNSVNNTVTTTPPPLNIKITTNDYDNNFIKVTIVNYAATNTVNVTTMPFVNGDILEIYDTQNMNGTPISITYNGSSYDFPMNNTDFAPLFQNDVDVSHASHTDSRFAEFLVRRVTGSGNPTPDQIIAKNDTGNNLEEGIAGQIVASVLNDNGNGVDILDGVAATLAAVTISLVSKTDIGISLNTVTGEVTVDANVLVGNHNLVYQICQQSDPTNCDNGTITFSITNTAPTIQAVNSFTLYDGSQNIVSGFTTIPNNAVINLQSVPTSLNIRANTTPTIVGSVYFQLDAAFTGENVAPYDWFGNGSGTFSLGAHTITATPYTEIGQAGAIGTPLTINFTVIDTSSTPIQAFNDSFSGDTDGGDVGIVTENDLFNNINADINLITATLTSDGGSGASITGGNTLSMPIGINSGTYNLTYEICEIASPANCDSANITVVITDPVSGKTEQVNFQTTFRIYKDNISDVYSVDFTVDTVVEKILVYTEQGDLVIFKDYLNQVNEKVYELTGVTAGSFYIVIYFQGYYIGEFITLD